MIADCIAHHYSRIEGRRRHWLAMDPKAYWTLSSNGWRKSLFHEPKYKADEIVQQFHPMPVGTPEMVADVFEDWINIADVDGFNVAYVSNPGSFEDVVELLVPELQRRGLMPMEYAVPGGTLRENLLRQPGQAHLRHDHYGHGFAWEKTHDAFGKEIIKEKVAVVKEEKK